MEEEALRCKAIVEGLLDLARPAPPAQGPVQLHAECAAVVERLREAGSLAGVEVRLEGEATAWASASKVRQVLHNLLRNAAEAAGAGGEVRAALEERGGEALAVVDDSGAGLSGAAQERLFEPFFTTKESGTGLGLAVSRAIARAHGGDVEAGSAPGGGARFTLRLPLPAPAAPALAPRAAAPEGVP